MSIDLILEQLGKLHLITLHFPIVLILLTPLIMALSTFSSGRFWVQAIPYFVHAASLSALVVTILGYLLAVERVPLEGALYWHRFFGTAATAAILPASLFLLFKKLDLGRRIPVLLWTLVLAAALLVQLAGHFGGISVHGDILILFAAAE